MITLTTPVYKLEPMFESELSTSYSCEVYINDELVWSATLIVDKEDYPACFAPGSCNSWINKSRYVPTSRDTNIKTWLELV